jgi:hypothetical protein
MVPKGEEVVLVREKEVKPSNFSRFIWISSPRAVENVQASWRMSRAAGRSAGSRIQSREKLCLCRRRASLRYRKATGRFRL